MIPQLASVALDGTLSLGLNPATTGQIRLPNNVGVYARNGANSGDLAIAQLTSANQLVIGDPGLPSQYHDVSASGVHHWRSNLTDVMTLSAAGRLNAAGGYASMLLGDVPFIVVPILGSSVAATGGGGVTILFCQPDFSVWTDFGSPITFTPTSSGVAWWIMAGGLGLLIPNSSAEYGSRLKITPTGGTTFYVPVGGDGSDGALPGNIFSGAIPQIYTGLAAVSHSIQYQAQSTVQGQLYIRGTSGELVNVQIVEFRR